MTIVSNAAFETESLAILKDAAAIVGIKVWTDFTGSLVDGK